MTQTLLIGLFGLVILLTSAIVGIIGFVLLWFYKRGVQGGTKTPENNT